MRLLTSLCVLVLMGWVSRSAIHKNKGHEKNEAFEEGPVIAWYSMCVWLTVSVMNGSSMNITYRLELAVIAQSYCLPRWHLYRHTFWCADIYLREIGQGIHIPISKCIILYDRYSLIVVSSSWIVQDAIFGGHFTVWQCSTVSLSSLTWQKGCMHFGAAWAVAQWDSPMSRLCWLGREGCKLRPCMHAHSLTMQARCSLTHSSNIIILAANWYNIYAANWPFAQSPSIRD